MTAPQQELSAAITAFEDALARNDADGFDARISSDWVIIEGGGSVIDRASFLATMRTAPLSMMPSVSMRASFVYSTEPQPGRRGLEAMGATKARRSISTNARPTCGSTETSNGCAC